MFNPQAVFVHRKCSGETNRAGSIFWRVFLLNSTRIASARRDPSPRLSSYQKSIWASFMPYHIFTASVFRTTAEPSQTRKWKTHCQEIKRLGEAARFDRPLEKPFFLSFWYKFFRGAGRHWSSEFVKSLVAASQTAPLQQHGSLLQYCSMNKESEQGQATLPVRPIGEGGKEIQL
ncbi:hypothetical protein ABW19_dt0204770 [Dactylella cylindrospora]|nr:hypothetical protein ABW19_dt0204770 [Dactylella cylindrospora]